MIPAFRHPDWVNLNQFVDSVADPSDNKGIANELKTNVLQPILSNWIHRPTRGKASLIFYGPPGTRKTTLAYQIAQALQWPLLTLSPPDFLKSGLEGFEACAAEIFNNLLHLRRVIVLLDECEDFFKARPKDQRIEIRTTGAFITSGMLPRLQKLHDQRWIIFILATNSELDDLDEAVRRVGRFDYAQEIGYPTKKAQIHYICKQKELSPQKTDAVQEALELEHLAAVPNAPYISFALLDRLVEKVITMEEKPSPKSILAVLKELLKQKGPPPLISTSEPELIEKNEIAEQGDHSGNSSVSIDI